MEININMLQLIISAWPLHNINVLSQVRDQAIQFQILVEFQINNYCKLIQINTTSYIYSLPVDARKYV